MKSNLIEKLRDKGFDGSDIHKFFLRFNISIIIFPPLAIPQDVVDELDLDAEAQKIIQDDYKSIYSQIMKSQWDEAHVAADFEKHK